MDGEEIGRVVQLGDQRKFLDDCVAHLAGEAVRVTPGSSLPGQIFKVGLRGFPFGHRFVGIFVFQLVEREGASLRDLDAAAKRILMAAEEPRHLLRRFDMPLGIGFEAEAGLGNGAFLADAGEHVLKGAAVRGVIERGVGGNEWKPRALAEFGECRDAGTIVATIGMPRREIEPRRRAQRLPYATKLLFIISFVMPAKAGIQ